MVSAMKNVMGYAYKTRPEIVICEYPSPNDEIVTLCEMIFKSIGYVWFSQEIDSMVGRAGTKSFFFGGRRTMSGEAPDACAKLDHFIKGYVLEITKAIGNMPAIPLRSYLPDIDPAHVQAVKQLLVHEAAGGAWNDTHNYIFKTTGVPRPSANDMKEFIRGIPGLRFYMICQAYISIC